MARVAQPKQDFATRLARQTLAQLDALVEQGQFPNRTAAIEAAVAHLVDAQQQDLERRRRAFEHACGALSLGIDRHAWERAELDRLDWEHARLTGRQAESRVSDG